MIDGGVHTSKGIMEDPAAALEKAAALDLASNPVEEMAALLLPASPYAGSAAGEFYFRTQGIKNRQ